MYIGCNVLWLMSTVHLKTKTKTKVHGYQIWQSDRSTSQLYVGQPDQTRPEGVSTSLSQTFLELAFLFWFLYCINTKDMTGQSATYLTTPFTNWWITKTFLGLKLHFDDSLSSFSPPKSRKVRNKLTIQNLSLPFIVGPFWLTSDVSDDSLNLNLN